MIHRGTLKEYLTLLKKNCKVTIISEVMGTPYLNDVSISTVFLHSDLLVRDVTSFNVYHDDYNCKLIAITIDDYENCGLPDLSYYWKNF